MGQSGRHNTSVLALNFKAGHELDYGSKNQEYYQTSIRYSPLNPIILQYTYQKEYLILFNNLIFYYSQHYI